MNTFKVSSFVMLVLFAFSSCESKLDLAPVTSTGENGFFKNRSEVELGVFGVYNAFLDVTSVEYLFTELRSDNATSHNNEGNPKTLNLLAELPGTGEIELYWKAQYQVIGRANKVLKYIGNVEGTTDRNELEAELRFLRAYSHFTLARLFGAVPYISSEITYEDTEYFSTKPASEIFTLLETEFKFAVDNLPETRSSANVGRVTKVAAQAALAQLYVVEGKNSMALPLLNEVIGDYKFTIPFADLFLDSNEMNEEIVFAIRFTSGVAGQTFSYEFSSGGSFGGLCTIEPSLLALYDVNDTRKSVSVVGDEFLNKFSDNTSISSGDDWIYIRKAESLLLRAEINATADAGVSASAIADLNLLRVRAGLAEYTSFATKEDLLAAIDLERRLELFGEGYRMFDLIRKGNDKAAQILSANLGETITPNVVLLPIPQGQIDISGGALVQTRVSN